MMIYLDNAATTLKKPDSVIRAVVDALQNIGNAGRGAHEAALNTTRLLYDTRLKLAELFQAGNAAQVAFTANSTESLNIAIQGLFQAGDHVITTALEHNSVLRPLWLMEQQGLELTILPADRQGKIQYHDFEAAIRGNTRAVVCTHVSNLTGNKLDIGRIGAICKKHDILLVVDASQSAGVFDIRMDEMGIDVLCFTGHKGLMGPQGTGGICVRAGLSIRPLIVGGSGIHTYSRTHPDRMPEALEAGTQNGHGIAGLHAALEFIEQIGLDRIREKEGKMLRQFYEGVKQIPTVTIYGDFEDFNRGAIIALNIGGYDSGIVADELMERFGISVRAGAHCAPLLHEALGTKEQGAVRFSMSYFNTEEEIEIAVDAVRQLAEEQKG